MKKKETHASSSGSGSGSGGDEDIKLYIGMLAHSSTEDDVRKLFEPYGVIKEVHLMKTKDEKSKGAAFVKYTSRDEAVRAINALHNRHRDGSAPGPLQVRFCSYKTRKKILCLNKRHLFLLFKILGHLLILFKAIFLITILLVCSILKQRAQINGIGPI